MSGKVLKTIHALLPGGITLVVPLLRGIAPEFRGKEWRFRYSAMTVDRLHDQLESKPDGLIAYLGSAKDVEVAKRFPFPVVNLSNKMPRLPFPTVSHASRNIGEIAAEHLFELPTKTYAVFGIQSYAYSCRRVDGFVSAMRAQNRTVETLWFDGAAGTGVGKSHDWFTPEQLQFILKALPRPVSIFAADQADLLMEAAALAGLRVPQDVRILGVDHNPVTDMNQDIRLSYVKMDFTAVGQLAALTLKRMLAGEAVPDRQEVLSPGVVEHQSTGLLSENDPWVAEACRFIHDHATKPIQVEDVVNQVPACRSLLARRFKEETGMGIGTMIRRERLRAAKRLLIDTDLSLEEIALQCGYSDPPRLFEAMRKAEGCTPSAYRKRMGGGLLI
jgi:LacI family transcriptional regulator